MSEKMYSREQVKAILLQAIWDGDIIRELDGVACFDGISVMDEGSTILAHPASQEQSKKFIEQFMDKIDPITDDEHNYALLKRLSGMLVRRFKKALPNKNLFTVTLYHHHEPNPLLVVQTVRETWYVYFKNNHVLIEDATKPTSRLLGEPLTVNDGNLRNVADIIKDKLLSATKIKY